MSQFSGRGYVLDGGPSTPFFNYRIIFRFLYFSVLIQACLSYIFFALGVIFSSNSYHNHLIGFYALVFGVVGFLYNLSYKPIRDRVHLFFPKLEEDVVKHTFYFLVGVPGISKSDSFQYQLGSILFSLVGFVGTMLSLRDQNLLNSYLNTDPLPYQEP